MAVAILSALAVLGVSACSDEEQSSGDVDDQVQVSSRSSQSVHREEPKIVKVSDLTLKTVAEVENILSTGKWQPNLAVEEAFTDSSIDLGQPGITDDWLVSTVCLDPKDKRTITVTISPESDISEATRQNIREGYYPRKYPPGECDESRKEIDLNNAP